MNLVTKIMSFNKFSISPTPEKLVYQNSVLLNLNKFLVNLVTQRPNLMNLSCVAEPPTAGSNMKHRFKAKASGRI